MSLTSANSRLVLEESVLSGCKNEFVSNEEQKQAKIVKYWWTLGIAGKPLGAFFATHFEGSGLESYGAVGHVKVSFEKWWALGILSHVAADRNLSSDRPSKSPQPDVVEIYAISLSNSFETRRLLPTITWVLSFDLGDRLKRFISHIYGCGLETAGIQHKYVL